MKLSALSLLLAFVSGSCVEMLQGPRTVRQYDLQAWEGAPTRDLQMHPLFSTLPKRVERLSDGAEFWTFSNCLEQQQPISCNTSGSSMSKAYESSTSCSGGETNTTCCYNQFLVQGDHVASYRAIGNCYTDCSTRPASRQCGS